MEQKEETQQTETASRYQNERVSVAVHRRPACRIEFEVEVSPALVQTAYEKAIKSISKEATVAGFRKGKAPAELIAKNYPQQLDKSWQEAISDAAFREAEKLAHIPVLNGELKISYSMKSHSLEGGAKVSLNFETEPSVPQIDPKQISLKNVDRPAVNDDKIDETIRQVQLFFAEWKPITHRPIQENDFALLDVDVVEEDPPKKLFAGVRFEVTDRAMAKWMKDLVTGRRAGDTLEGVSVPDEDASAADKAELKPKKVRVVIHTVEEATVPPIDDTFAQRLGAPSFEAMRANVAALLNKQADDHVQEKLREQVSDALLVQFPFDIPVSLIDRETRFRMHQLLQDAEYLKFWNQMTSEARKRTVGSVAEQSEKAVRMFYICRKILADAGIRVSPSDLPKPSDAPLDMLLDNRRDYNPQENSEVHQAEAFSRLLLEKAEDYIIQNATLA